MFRIPVIAAALLLACQPSEPDEPLIGGELTTAPAPAVPGDDPIAGVLAGQTPAPADPAAEPADDDRPLVVWLEVEVEVPEDGRPLVEGRTNLPDDTMLVITLEDQGDFHTQDIASVADGAYAAGPFGPDEGISSGAYLARVAMSLPRSQPASVKAIIGDGGERLVGDAVLESDMGVTVETTQEFEVDVGSGRLLSGEEAREEANEVLAGLREVWQIGRDMEKLRAAADPNCGGQQAKAEDKLRALSKRAERLPGALTGPLRAAGNDLKHCVQCEGTALQMCTIADLSLKRGETQVASATIADLRPAE